MRCYQIVWYHDGSTAAQAVEALAQLRSILDESHTVIIFWYLIAGHPVDLA
jgi:hypothetical protein